ncbi:MAG: hypothetical protein LBK44_02835 [Spirochaetales bacterium]|nr:hypothetical protein [Spirochaetales bacterium]
MPHKAAICFRQQSNSTKIFLKFGRLPSASRRGRAFRSKSSDLPMQILWAFRFNPWRSGSSE